MADVVFERASCRYVGAEGAAVHELDLTVADGELLVVFGPAESGKSTVLRMLAGLVPVTEGRILVGGTDITADDAPLVSLVFQNYALYPNLTVAQNIGVPLVQERMSKTRIAERVAEVAGHLDLTSDLTRSASKLSAGQRTRVALARGLAREPAVMLMDEPLSNLEQGIRAEVVEMLVAAQRRHGITTVYATDDADEALVLGDRVAVLESGALQEIVVPDQVASGSPGARTLPS